MGEIKTGIKKYETVIIFRPDMTEEDQESSIQNILSKVNEKGKVTSEVEMKIQRKLAYEIKGYKEGYYVCFKFDIDQCLVKEIEILIRNSENVIKFIIAEVVE